MALRFKADYQAARVPMLPAVADSGAVASAIVGYSWAMVVTSLLLTPVAGMAGSTRVRPSCSVGPSSTRPTRCAVGACRCADSRAMRLFHGSISYLSLLFLVVAIDPFLA